MTDQPLSFPPAAGPSADGPGDEQLLRKVVAGDAASAQALVLRYHDPLMRYLRRLTGAANAAEDLHQQTWLSVLEHAGRFDAKAGGGFKAWLFRIATNKANDLWRKRRRERAFGGSGRGPDPDPDTHAALGVDRAEAAEEARRLADAVARLPEPQRQVLLLRYYGGLKFGEIAETLGCPLNTALGRMHKAMEKLKVLLGEDESSRKVSAP